jgi:hypothetical protein
MLNEKYTATAMNSELLGSLELDSSGECYRGKLFPKSFHFNEGTFIEKAYEADLELPIAQLETFKNLLATGLLDKAEKLIAEEFLETANLSREAAEDLTLNEFQRRLTLMKIEASEAALDFTYYDGGECGGHYLTLTLSWSGEALDFNMMG